MDIPKILTDGFSYAGHPFHIILNYTVLLLVLVPNIFGPERGQRAWPFLLVLFTIIQITLWFVTGAVGISLIWCALAGYNLLSVFLHRKESRAMIFLLAISPVIAIAAIVFYAIYFPPLTTVAHVIALLLGAVLGFRFRRRFSEKMKI